MTGSADLGGRRVVVTRSVEQSGPLTTAIRDAGGTVVPLPLLQIEDPPDGIHSLRTAIAGLGPHDWLAVTSPNGAERVVRSIESVPACNLAVVADGTAQVFTDHGWAPDLVPSEPTAQGMVDAFPAAASSSRVVVVQGDAARPTLVEGLRATGWQVEPVVAYVNAEPATSPAQRQAAAQADVVVFASPSAASRYADRVGVTPPAAACIGSVTAAVAGELGFTITVAETPTVPGLLDAIGRAGRRR